MRPIKFRAWRMRTGNMDYSKDWLTLGEFFDFHERNYSREQLVFMQYTGLKDKNGKEIYEGDIVKGKRHEEFSREHKRFIGEVVYVSPAFRINGMGQYKGIIHEELHGAYETIGNIYENPELMRK